MRAATHATEGVAGISTFATVMNEEIAQRPDHSRRLRTPHQQAEMHTKPPPIDPSPNPGSTPAELKKTSLGAHPNCERCDARLTPTSSPCLPPTPAPPT